MTDAAMPESHDPILSHSFIRAPEREPERWLFMLHGIYGKGRNWASIARRLVEARPEWGVVLVDLRLHGDSRGFRPPHTLQSSAADLARLVRHLGHGADAVLGHSFGGKVALEYAATAPAALRQVWVMDSTPALKIPSGSAWRMIDILRQMPEHFDSRAEAVAGLESHGYATGLAQWMAMNLEPAPGGGYRWAIDLDAMEEMLRDFFRTELWSVVEEPPMGMVLHFVKATESDTMDEETAERIEAAGRRNGRVFLHRVPGGHWINTDNPDGVLELLQDTM
jgi:pimeloyl-ACP methyl ester carboxylesterase